MTALWAYSTPGDQAQATTKHLAQAASKACLSSTISAKPSMLLETKSFHMVAATWRNEL